MWLVTHASGIVGRAVAQALVDKGQPVRAAVFHPVAAADVRLNADVVVLQSPSDPAVGSAFAGVDRLVLAAPLGADMADWYGALARAARAAGVKHVVQISAQGADAKSPMRVLRWLADAEARVAEAGLEPVVLRPAAFMQVLFKHTLEICGGGRIEAPYRTARWALIDARDVAEVAVVALEKGLSPRVLELTGPEALDYFEVAAHVSSVLGRDVQYRDICSPKARGKLEASSLPPRLIEGLLEFWDYVAAGAVQPTITNDVLDVLGRPPRNLQQFLQDMRAKFTATTRVAAAG